MLLFSIILQSHLLKFLKLNEKRFLFSIKNSNRKKNLEGVGFRESKRFCQSNFEVKAVNTVRKKWNESTTEEDQGGAKEEQNEFSRGRTEVTQT